MFAARFVFGGEGGDLRAVVGPEADEADEEADDGDGDEDCGDDLWVRGSGVGGCGVVGGFCGHFWGFELGLVLSGRGG